jgi:glycosyltransferase involved in cell wall biosynthesis
MSGVLAEPASPSGVDKPRGSSASRIVAHGKFFFRGDEKHYLKGVTYGPFGPGSHAAQLPEKDVIRRDLALMGELGANTLRVFTVPPRWFLDMASEANVGVLVGTPWTQHISFLDSRAEKSRIRQMVRDGVKVNAGHPALVAHVVGNEISPDVVRWHGGEQVSAFLKELYDIAKEVDPEGLVSYANFPSTEYLDLDFFDFLSFNVYLHREKDFRAYLMRLHNLAVDRPLVLTEFGMDSMREGLEHQAETLQWQVRAAYDMGVAGTCIFAWTDEWFTGGHAIEDWSFGLVDRAREKKPSFHAVRTVYHETLPPKLPSYPKVSVVVCAYNADRTMDACLASLEKLTYPNYEVIVVNDGSKDRTLEISERYGYVKIISQENKGLSVARNVGFEASTGEIIAYTDSDCVADPDWLTYMVAKMLTADLYACGGPNFPPPEDSLVPSAVAVSPGGPTHVLVSDDEAEHIAGCNMAFRREALAAINGFDPIFRSAGDDVDLCWRLQFAGYKIGFSPAATVWHFRRNTVEAYFGQQRGYGKAEAMVYAKHPFRFNLFGQAKWLGRIYGDLSASMLLSSKPIIYSGVFGRGLFQTLYEAPSSIAAFLPLTFEWNVIAWPLALSGVILGGQMWLAVLPLLVSFAIAIAGAYRAPVDPRFNGIRARALIAFLIYAGPLARGWERLKWRFKGLTQVDAIQYEPVRQRSQLRLAERAFYLSYWNEQDIEKESLLTGIHDFLVPRKYFVIIDQGWSDWDLKVSRGLWARAELKAVGENHGGSKRLIRLRVALRLSRLSSLVLKGYLGVGLVGLLFGVPALTIAAVAVGAINAAVIGYETFRLGRVLHRVTEIVAGRIKLLSLADRGQPSA